MNLEYRTFIDGDGQKQILGNEKWSKYELYVEPYFEITFLIDFDLFGKTFCCLKNLYLEFLLFLLDTYMYNKVYFVYT